MIIRISPRRWLLQVLGIDSLLPTHHLSGSSRDSDEKSMTTVSSATSVGILHTKEIHICQVKGYAIVTLTSRRKLGEEYGSNYAGNMWRLDNSLSSSRTR